MFIVLEGLDGAGKSTQIGLLRERFAQRGIESAYLHFPRFDAPVYGELVARFLRGEFGSADRVDPYLVGTAARVDPSPAPFLFAGARAEAAPQIRQWIADGKAVLLDRYVYSNVGYQCAKLPAGDERRRLARWILDLEFGHNALPRPDLSLFLDVPFSFTERKLSAVREGSPSAISPPCARATTAATCKAPRTSTSRRSPSSVPCARSTSIPQLSILRCAWSIAATIAAAWRRRRASSPRYAIC